MHGTPQLAWDDAVAESAQEWANSGVYQHSSSYEIPAPAGPAGENLAIGFANLADAVTAWYALWLYDCMMQGVTICSLCSLVSLLHAAFL